MSVLTLIKRAHVYNPKDMGLKDVLIGGRQILAIGDDLAIHGTLPAVNVVEADGLFLFPGLIDQHIHMAGGGGEGGFHYRTPEISLSHITTSGVTTAIGVLGTDGVTRTTRELLAKANGLDFEGVSTYIYCGAYQIPTRTITGMPRSDIVLIDKVIGVGEIAISDSRSSQPDEQEIAELASEAYVGGLLGGKAGVVHFHVGDDDSRLEILHAVVHKTQLPMSVFVPTHLNRNPGLLDASIEWGKIGGFVDITSGIRPDEHDDVSVKPSKAIRKLLDAGVDAANITMSSDSNGSSPIFDDKGKLVAMGIGNIATLWEETVDAIRVEGVPIETAVSIVTRHVARVLKLRYKGRVKPGYDADLILCDEAFKIQHVFCKGRHMVEDAKPLVFGTYEHASVPGSPQRRSESGNEDESRGRAMIDPDDDDDDNFPDRDERQAKSRRRRYCC
ncbi:beta-aspartyl-peptidase [Alicyclobacillus dauci]|uniref:Beta-aspartyl-peptidase n=1 Tax=Alicyclobacillus dauci TaxID=1475485 RepID=A0ABY6YYW6_9BACL|nr:beta-aspartyl-peptidase [Alicyclobacillus dauci]WAH35832.1 beta-aspartyl-peptidase [Alicyclobacillus dauci]